MFTASHITTENTTGISAQEATEKKYKSIVLTIAETEAFFKTKPFVPQRIIRLVKEEDGNVQAPHAIRAELPYIGTIGYVGNTPETAYKGTGTAKDIYDLFEDEAYVKVMFVTESRAIVLFTANDRFHRTWKRKMHSDENASDPILCTL